MEYVSNSDFMLILFLTEVGRFRRVSVACCHYIQYKALTQLLVSVWVREASIDGQQQPSDRALGPQTI